MIDAATPASSLILMRDRRGMPPELLIAQRSKALRFAGGAYVFPGGAVDPADRLLAALHCATLDPDDAAARIAAARETLEETSVIVGLVPAPLPSPDSLYGALLDGDAHRFDADAFTSFARWMPQASIRRRFDTRFYLAAAPAGCADPKADGAETEAAFWASAADILARCDQGDGFALFPTRRMLERLARFANIADAVAQARMLPERTITPQVEEKAGVAWLTIPEDAGYPVTRELLETARRG